MPTGAAFLSRATPRRTAAPAGELHRYTSNLTVPPHKGDQVVEVFRDYAVWICGSCCALVYVLLTMGLGNFIYKYIFYYNPESPPSSVNWCDELRIYGWETVVGVVCGPILAPVAALKLVYEILVLIRKWMTTKS